MTRPETSTVFAGVDGRANTRLPEWYASPQSMNEPVSFTEAIRDLPRAVETTVAYSNPYTDEWVETERFNALVDPERLYRRSDDDSHDDEIDPLFHIPTTSYAVINPSDVYGPLEDVLRDESLDGTPLGDVVFGEVRQYRGGGEVHMEVLFDGLTVDLPHRTDPITMGVTSGYDYFGTQAVYVEGFARDGVCANSIRSLTDRETVKHVGDVADFGAWWTDILSQLELIANDLHAFIVDAQEITVDFSAVPFDVEEFYALLGFPDYLAERAASDAWANADDPIAIDMWTLHSGATYALTHFFAGHEGSALDRYVRAANDVLFNPDATIDVVEEAYERRAEAETSEGQTALDSQVALAQLERVGRDVRERAATFEQREQTLRERLARLSD